MLEGGLKVGAKRGSQKWCISGRAKRWPEIHHFCHLLIYIYIYREREIEIDIYACVYLYIYIYRERERSATGPPSSSPPRPPSPSPGAPPPGAPASWSEEPIIIADYSLCMYYIIV